MRTTWWPSTLQSESPRQPFRGGSTERARASTMEAFEMDTDYRRPPSMSFLDTGVDAAELNWATVLAQERRCIEEHFSERQADGKPGVRFSLAFSGGGVRAAAFQSGVLWSLAKADMLKDVEYLAAVSGGGYITSAFASHCAAARAPKQGEVKQWYLERVAATLLRMQHNSGNFVRDAGLECGTPKDGAGKLPRILDFPVLFLIILATICINPFYYAVCLVIPMTVIIEMYFGAGMRAAFCATEEDYILDLMETYSPFKPLYWTCIGLFAASVFAFLLSGLVFRPPWQRGQNEEAPTNKHSEGARKWNLFYIGMASRALLKRLTMYSAVVLTILLMAIYFERYKYAQSAMVAELRYKSCAFYVLKGRTVLQQSHDNEASGMDCADQYFGRYWYSAGNKTELLVLQPSESDEERYKLGGFEQMDDVCNNKALESFAGDIVASASHSSNRHHPNLVSQAVRVLCLCVLVTTLLVPVLGSSPLIKVLIIAGPVLLMAITITCVRFVVFGPITGNVLGVVPGLGNFPFCRSVWTRWVSYVFLCWFFLVPLYEEGRRMLHRYYKWCLCKNFFHNGKDMSFKELERQPYCPYVVLTGTCSDWKRGGERKSIFELFFSAKHCGGTEVGFMHQPTFRTLAKCTALTGAGCLDAITLTMSDMMVLRFWLEVLSLSWGDFIIFTRNKVKGMRQEWVDHASSQHNEWFFTFVHRFIAGLPVFILIALLNIGWALEVLPSTWAVAGCRDIKLTFACFLGFGWLLYALSFFSFLESFEVLAMSPILRHIHQATKHTLVGEVPPPLLYVTDGGVKDCTALCQLFARRCERILLVLAAADPSDELAVLKAALSEAEDKCLASFYVPEDPRLAVAKCFESFKEQPDKKYMHVGICYPCNSESDDKKLAGHLLIVKNRLPPEWRGQRVQPPFTAKEIVEGIPPPELQQALDSEELGGCPCCNCCHSIPGLNCGPKFPHGSFTGYLWLSPMWFSSLARLGFALANEVVDTLRQEDLTPEWERGLPRWPDSKSATT